MVKSPGSSTSTTPKQQATPRRLKQPKVEMWRSEQFRYPDDLGIRLPALVLGIEVEWYHASEDDGVRAYRFKAGSGFDFKPIVHQVGGLRCNHRYIVGTVLPWVNVEVLQNAQRLNERWYDSSVSTNCSMDTLNEYRADVKRLLGADANHSHSFEEAYYPIDIEHLPKLTSATLPADYDDLIDFRDGFERAMGCMGRWSAVILASNSD